MVPQTCLTFVPRAGLFTYFSADPNLWAFSPPPTQSTAIGPSFKSADIPTDNHNPW